MFALNPQDLSFETAEVGLDSALLKYRTAFRQAERQ